MSSKIGKYLSAGLAAGAGAINTGLEDFDDEGVAVTVDAAPYEVLIPEVQPVTQVEYLEAQDALIDYDEAAAIDRQDEVDTYEAIDEAQVLLVSMEEYGSLMKLGKERGEFTQATAAGAIVMLDYAKQRMGDEGLVVPSLEDYSADNIEALYDVGIESLDGFFSKLNNMIATGAFNATAGLWSSAKSAARKAMADALTKQADNILEDANNTEHYTWPSDKLSVPVSGLGKRLGQAGKFPANVVAAIEQDVKGCNWMLTQYPKKAGEFVRKVTQGMQVVGKATKGKVEDTAKPFTNIKLPSAGIPSNVLDGSTFIGNVQIALATAKEAKGEGVAADLRKLVQVPVYFAKTDVAADPSELKLGKADLVKLCNAVKAYAQLIIKADGEWEKEIKGSGAAANVLRAKELQGSFNISWAEGGVLDAMGDVLTSAPRHLSSPFSESIGHAKAAAQAALFLASRTLGAAEA